MQLTLNNFQQPTPNLNEERQKGRRLKSPHQRRNWALHLAELRKKGQIPLDKPVLSHIVYQNMLPAKSTDKLDANNNQPKHKASTLPIEGEQPSLPTESNLTPEQISHQEQIDKKLKDWVYSAFNKKPVEKAHEISTAPQLPVDIHQSNLTQQNTVADMLFNPAYRSNASQSDPARDMDWRLHPTANMTISQKTALERIISLNEPTKLERTIMENMRKKIRDADADLWKNPRFRAMLSGAIKQVQKQWPELSIDQRLIAYAGLLSGNIALEIKDWLHNQTK